MGRSKPRSPIFNPPDVNAISCFCATAAVALKSISASIAIKLCFIFFRSLILQVEIESNRSLYLHGIAVE